MLLLFAGLPGTGKTTLADAYAAETGILHLNSDRLRAELGLRGDYRPEAKQLVYDELLHQTRHALESGKTVLVDSTFYKKEVRRPFEHLACECGVPLLWIETTASESALRERLGRPRPDSEADYAVYEKIRDQAEPLPDDRLVIHTDTEPVTLAVQKIRQYVAAYEH